MSDELKLEKLIKSKSVKSKKSPQFKAVSSVDMPANALFIVTLAVISLGTIGMMWVLAFRNY